MMPTGIHLRAIPRVPGDAPSPVSSGRILPDSTGFESAERKQLVAVLALFVETRDRNGELVHRAKGNLVWGKRHHIGGTDLRDLGFDRPDYEVNSSLISPEKIWTSL